MYLLGIDIGSSSVKASIVDGTTGNVLHLLSIETGDENYRQTNRLPNRLPNCGGKT